MQWPKPPAELDARFDLGRSERELDEQRFLVRTNLSAVARGFLNSVQDRRSGDWAAQRGCAALQSKERKGLAPKVGFLTKIALDFALLQNIEI